MVTVTKTRKPLVTIPLFDLASRVKEELSLGFKIEEVPSSLRHFEADTINYQYDIEGMVTMWANIEEILCNSLISSYTLGVKGGDFGLAKKAFFDTFNAHHKGSKTLRIRSGLADARYTRIS